MEYPEKQLITWVDDSGEYVGLCEYIRADLVPQWQPISTAPKDGGYILGAWAWASVIGGTIQPMCWDDGQWVHGWDRDPDHPLHPTHWMPLPAPPSP